ncbi:hypothetical protein BGZ46_008355 [Entomortierella lignicola]|nr:hypothetical protein BGZ46_008355 [Entomortierella lignicola]
MRFQTVLAAAIAIIATVSAQNPGVPSEACANCYGGNIVATPACAGIQYQNMNLQDPDSATRTCLCALANNMSWLTSCSTSCSSQFISELETAYHNLPSSICAGISTTSSKSASVSLSAPKTGAAFVIAAACAQALL